ncbi:MAG: sigma-70 family RNA polymerase sigma factor [Planctomycetes bacterium]|nr:sigma-70 family RNA polymerase sigma factor [Planctomycetota bacterium]
MDADQGLPADLARETDALRRIARGVLFEPALAEDAVQDAWLAALRSPRGTVTGGWLGESVKRIARGIRRRETRIAARERAAPRRDDSASASETAERIELLRTLLTALHELDEPYRTAVRLRWLDDLPPSAIAERLNVPVETVRTHVRRGVERMRAKLDVEHRARCDGRDAFLAAVVPFVGVDAIRAGLTAHAGFGVWGGVLVGTKLKWLAALAVIACIGLWWRNAATRPSAPAETAREPVAVLDASAASESARAADAANEVAGPTATSTQSARAVAGGEHAVWTISGSALLGRKVPMPHETVKLTLRRGYGDDGEVLVERELVTNDVGVFELPLDPPTCGVTVRVSGRNPDFAVFSDRRWCTPGESAPTGLAVGFYPLDATIRGRVVELDGTPIRGARVVGFGATATSTDEDGEFESRASSLSSPTMLDVSDEAHLDRQISLDVARPGAVDGVEIRLERGARIFGRVLSEDGRPLAGATITASYSWSTNTPSDADGRFEFNNAPRNPGRYLVTAEVDGVPVSALERDDPTPPQEELLLVAHSTRPIEGRVIDEHGVPVPAATITARLGWFAEQYASSDDLGAFRFGAVARAEHTLSVEKVGFARVRATLAADADAPLELVLDHGRTLRGVVRGEDGRPIAGVSVATRVDGLPNYEEAVRSAVDGAFELPNTPPGDRTEVEAYGDGWPVAQQKVVDDAAPIELVMRRSAGISGRVVDAETLRPITRFRIAFVMPVLEPGERHLPRHRGEWVEPGLEFENEGGLWSTEFDALEPDTFTGIAVHAAGYGTRILPRVKTSTNSDAEPLVIALGRARVLVGRVVEKSSGRGLAGARVKCFSKRAPFIFDASSGLPLSITDDRGEFRLEDLPEEPVSLAVEADGFARRIEGPLEAPFGESRRDIELTTGATLRGRLFDGHDRTLARQTVRLGAGGTDEIPFREWKATTDADGAFQFTALPTGEYFLSHTVPDRHASLARLTRYVRVDEERTLEVELRPPGTLTLRGELHASVPLPGNLAIRAWRTTDRLDVACLSERALFELEGLAPGKWYVSAAWYDGDGSHDLVGHVELDVGEHDPAPILIDLQPPLRHPPDQVIRNDAPAKQ